MGSMQVARRLQPGQFEELYLYGIVVAIVPFLICH